MGCHILFDEDKDLACFYDSTVDVAFGPVMNGDHNYSAEEMGEWFLKWLGDDPRHLMLDELLSQWSKFRVEVNERDETLSEEEAVKQIVFGHFEQPVNLDPEQCLEHEGCFKALYHYYLPEIPMNTADKREWIRSRLQDLWED